MSRKIPSVFPEKYQILSGSALKMIAMITMLIDHIGCHILINIPSAREPLFRFLGDSISWYQLCRDIGRMAFPIFVFLVCEGFIHTRSRFLYGRNLLLFALISEIPWNLAHTGTLYYDRQNVYFTLFAGYIGLCILHYLKDYRIVQLLLLGALLLLANPLSADYGWKGILLMLVMYWMREIPLGMIVTSSCLYNNSWKTCSAFLPISLYNGERGFIKGRMKYIFYLFYPVHILILAVFQFHLLGF